MPTTTFTDWCYAHTGPDEEVFLCDVSGPPRASGLTCAEFATECGARPVRIVALPENAALITSLAECGAGRVEIGRPNNILWAHLVATGPKSVLVHARSAAPEAPSRGGWHGLTELDQASYALAAHYRSGGGHDDAAARLYARHPARPALDFITHLDHEAASRLLAEILDPRWFIDPDQPDRDARLKCYLGLTSNQNDGSEPRRRRRALVRSAWHGSGDRYGDCDEPRYFLWRTWYACDPENGAEAADAVVSRRFISYLKSVWLDSLLGGAWCAGGLFLPEYWFREPDEVAAWYAFHAARCAG
jgi:hypothetical protein